MISEHDIKIDDDYDIIRDVRMGIFYLSQLKTDPFLGHDIGALKNMILYLFELNLNRFIYNDDDITDMIKFDEFWGYWDLQDPLNFMISDPLGV